MPSPLVDREEVQRTDADPWDNGPGPTDQDLRDAELAGEWMARNTTDHAMTCAGWPCDGSCEDER